MRAAREVIREYARYYAVAFNLNIARPIFERTPNCIVLRRRTALLSISLKRAAANCPDEDTHNNRGYVDPFHS